MMMRPGIVKAASGIVAGNLALHLDAGDAASYSGSGQAWNDLSGNGFHFWRGVDNAAAGDDPTFNGSGGGLSANEYFSFDGGDFFVQQAAHSGSLLRQIGRSGQPFTAEVWSYITSTSGVQLMGSINGGNATNRGWAFEWSFTSSQRIGQLIGPAGTRTGNATNVALSAWKQLAIAGDNDGSGITYYVNGAADGTASPNNSSWTSGAQDSQLTLDIGRGGGSGAVPSGTRIAIVRLYSRALSAGEIAQNWTFNRTRFGI